LAAAFNPAHPGGFAMIALITALVVLLILPAIDKLAGAAEVPLG
jgi:hypothetical protein